MEFLAVRAQEKGYRHHVVGNRAGNGDCRVAGLVLSGCLVPGAVNNRMTSKNDNPMYMGYHFSVKIYLMC